jgi:hypothetical protein
LLEKDAVTWLVSSKDPSVRYLTLTDLLEYPADSSEVEECESQILSGPKMSRLLSGQRADGGFGVHPYHKWTGAHWRLVSMVELAIPENNKQALKATDGVLEWLYSDDHLQRIITIKGLTRRCASQEGNALGVCSYLGMADDPRVSKLAQSLVEWQWPDGGWNCDKRPGASHSSFNESLVTLWGLLMYQKATGDKEVARAAGRACEFFLAHHIFCSHKTGKVVKPFMVKLHYPSYWHHDFLQALRILALAGQIRDPRVSEALDLLESKRKPDGLWYPDGYYWKPKKPAGNDSQVEVVGWGRDSPNEMITLNSLRILKAAKRIKIRARSRVVLGAIE